MYTAVFKFTELAIPEFRVYVTGWGDPERVRKLLKRACYRKHIVVKFEPERFVPLVIREFSREANVTITVQEFSPRPIYDYTIMHDTDGTPMLRILEDIGQEEMQLLYVGPFFQFLLHSLKGDRPKKHRYDPLQTKVAKESRRLAREQALKEKVRQEDGSLQTPEHKLTPLQQHLRASAEREQKRRARHKLATIRGGIRRKKHRRLTKLREQTD